MLIHMVKRIVKKSSKATTLCIRIIRVTSKEISHQNVNINLIRFQ